MLVMGLLLWCKLAAGLILMPGLMLNTCSTPYQHLLSFSVAAPQAAMFKACHAWHAWCVL
jgi:hypothetical protein